MRQNWKKIGFSNSLKPIGNFKKYEPKQQRSQSGNKSIKSLNKSRSYQKIKLSIEARDSSKHTSQQSSFRQIDLSYQTRQASPISKQKSNTSIFQQEKIQQHYHSPYLNLYALLHKILNYTDDLKDKLISLRKYVKNRDEQFVSQVAKMKKQSFKLVQSFSEEFIKQKNALKIALSKINELNLQNKNLNKKILTLSQQKQTTVYPKQSVQIQNNLSFIPNSYDQMLKHSSVSTNNKQQSITNPIINGVNVYQLKGLNQIQTTLKRLKLIFIENSDSG